MGIKEFLPIIGNNILNMSNMSKVSEGIPAGMTNAFEVNIADQQEYELKASLFVTIKEYLLSRQLSTDKVIL